MLSPASIPSEPASHRAVGRLRVRHINKITDVGPANAQLRSQGLHNFVVVPMSPACRDHFGMSYLATNAHPAPTVGLTRHRLPGFVWS